jgi:hypothetical protein
MPSEVRANTVQADFMHYSQVLARCLYVAQVSAQGKQEAKVCTS